MVMDYIIEDLMEEVVERKGSDLHISAGLPPLHSHQRSPYPHRSRSAYP